MEQNVFKNLHFFRCFSTKFNIPLHIKKKVRIPQTKEEIITPESWWYIVLRQSQRDNWLVCCIV
jgi:hypothetical protein